MQLTQYIGDSTSHEIPLTWAGDNFTPGEAWSLIFTAKRSAQDSDDAAVFQKVTGAGISVTGNTAEVEIVPADTLALPSATYIWDIQAQSLSTGEVRTVALGGIKLVRDVTRKTTSSVEIHTIEPGAPFTGPQGPQGPQGLKGDTGSVGPQGEVGPAGNDALWNYTGAYSGGASYAVGDVVTYNGELFYRKNSNGGNVGDTPFAGSTFWDLLAAKGEQGPAGTPAPTYTFYIEGGDLFMSY
jgi:hypothetical protein